jgi:23S rRNA (guanosine2251-2'-O)-methyltransferase
MAGRGEPEGEVLTGWNPVLEALEAGSRDVERVYLADGQEGARARRLRSAARRRGVPVLRRGKRRLQELAGAEPHQGVVAIVAPMAFRRLDEVLDEVEGPPLLVLADGVEDPRNLGALVRTAAAAGAHALVVPSRRAAGITGTVARAAAGALERIPLVREANLAKTVEALQGRGVWTVGLDAGGDTRWDEVDWTLPTAVVVGAEGRGLRSLVRRRCDVLAGLPLAQGVESLNVSVALGAVLYEARRQRDGAGRRAGRPGGRRRGRGTA